MKRKVIGLILWFSCGYYASAMYTAEFYGRYGASGVETRGSASRSSLLLFAGGPFGAFAAVINGSYRPMWDWPRYLLDDYKIVSPKPESGEK